MPKIKLLRQDHYEVARRRQLQELRGQFQPARLQRLGAVLEGGAGLELKCLAWRLRVELDPFSITLLPGGQQVDIVWQILALDYLCGKPAGPPGEFVSFAHFAGLRGYLQPFRGRVERRLSRGLGRERAAFLEAAQRCAGQRGTRTPLTYMFRFFPRLEFQVVRHEGDQEFPPTCNVLFADNALDLLSAEGLIVAAERLVSALEGGSPAASENT